MPQFAKSRSTSGLLVAAAMLLLAMPVTSFAQGCSSPADSTHGCIGLDDVGFCTAVCSETPSQFIAAAVSDTNFYPKLRRPGALALIQAAPLDMDKRVALDNARQILGKAGFTTVDVNSIQDAIAAINAAFAANGDNPIHVVIVGHGRPGSIKVGEDRLNNDTPEGSAAQAKFVQSVRGKIVNLTLVGCRTGDGEAGQALLTKLSSDLGGIELHAWTGDIQPDTVDKTFYAQGIKKPVVVPVRQGSWGSLKLIYR